VVAANSGGDGLVDAAQGDEGEQAAGGLLGAAVGVVDEGAGGVVEAGDERGGGAQLEAAVAGLGAGREL
jgi:hypothetical protein